MATENLAPVAISRGLLHRLLQSISESGPWGPVLAELTFVVVVLLVTAFFWWLVGRLMVRALARSIGATPESLQPVRTGARSLITLAALGSLIGHFTELDLFTIVAGTFALIATGFVALWSTLSNILCTILILVTRPFRIGDEIAFPPDSFEGEVIDLSFFFTTLKMRDGRFVNVPNTTFFQRIMVRREAHGGKELGEQLAAPKPSEPPRANG